MAFNNNPGLNTNCILMLCLFEDCVTLFSSIMYYLFLYHLFSPNIYPLLLLKMVVLDMSLMLMPPLRYYSYIHQYNPF